jgi:phosphatidate cytidylyltransferase
MTETPTPKNSDLMVRVLSAIVMVAVAGGALWQGGAWFDGLIVIVAATTFFEMVYLIIKATNNVTLRLAGIVAGAFYVGFAAWLLIEIDAKALLLLIIGTVVMIDIGAYFVGRGVGGPKIAPSISPSKTWAGLAGGVLGAMLSLGLYFYVGSAAALGGLTLVAELLPFAIVLAVVAQTGDFCESWLKRRAGVKDSSSLIPGHGGFFDRVDGLLPVAILIGSVVLIFYPHWLGR